MMDSKARDYVIWCLKQWYSIDVKKTELKNFEKRIALRFLHSIIPIAGIDDITKTNRNNIQRAILSLLQVSIMTPEQVKLDMNRQAIHLNVIKIVLNKDKLIKKINETLPKGRQIAEEQLNPVQFEVISSVENIIAVHDTLL